MWPQENPVAPPQIAPQGAAEGGLLYLYKALQLAEARRDQNNFVPEAAPSVHACSPAPWKCRLPLPLCLYLVNLFYLKVTVCPFLLLHLYFITKPAENWENSTVKSQLWVGSRCGWSMLEVEVKTCMPLGSMTSLSQASYMGGTWKHPSFPSGENPTTMCTSLSQRNLYFNIEMTQSLYC